MSELVRPDMRPAVIDDFERVREALIDLASEPDARVEFVEDGSGVAIKLGRLAAAERTQDEELAGVYITNYANGRLVNTAMGQTLRLHHGQKVERPELSVKVYHNYFFESREGELVEYTHGLRAIPDVVEAAPQLTDIGDQWQAFEGKRLLRTDFGKNLELLSGDCSLLVRRLGAFIGLDCHRDEIQPAELPQSELLEKFSI